MLGFFFPWQIPYSGMVLGLFLSLSPPTFLCCSKLAVAGFIFAPKSLSLSWINGMFYVKGQKRSGSFRSVVGVTAKVWVYWLSRLLPIALLMLVAEAEPVGESRIFCLTSVSILAWELEQKYLGTGQGWGRGTQDPQCSTRAECNIDHYRADSPTAVSLCVLVAFLTLKAHGTVVQASHSRQFP